MSENDPAPLLREWHETTRPVRVLFQAGSGKTGWRRAGTISRLGLTEFEVAWDEGGSQVFQYNVTAIIDGRQLLFRYAPSGDQVVVHEQ